MTNGRYSFQDLELLFTYLKKNCEGNLVRFSIEINGTLTVSTKTKFDDDVKINIYDESTQLFPKIIKEDRLRIE